MTDVFKIADILVSHAVREYKDDVAIIVYCGSYAKGTASPTSDLDLYYIPDEGKAGSLSSQFVIGGLPYDLWPVSWQMAEEIANATSRRPWAVSASLIADTKVLYYRAQQDLERFNALKARIAELTQPECQGAMVARALEEFKSTLSWLGQIRLGLDDGDIPGTQWAGLQFVGSAVNCLALVNQTYFSKGWGFDLPQLLQLSQRPDNLLGLIEGIVLPQDPGAVLQQAERLAKGVRRVLLDAQASIATPAPADQVFKDFYYYVFEYKNKVMAACEREDRMAAAFAAFNMQEQICQLMNKVERGFFPTDTNLLGEYVGGYAGAGFPDLFEPASRGDLRALADQVQRLDETIREWLASHSIDLNILANEGELSQFLNQRI